MQFDPAKHTKEFLLRNASTALGLAKTSAHFAIHHLAQDLEVLSLADEFGTSVAHNLTANQPAWAKTEAPQRLDVVSISNNNGVSVAHCLAWNQPEWLSVDSPIYKAILCLSSDTDGSVAQVLLNVSRSKGEIITNFINCGFAYKTNQNTHESRQLKLNFSDIETFVKLSGQSVEDEVDQEIKLKKSVCFHSTLKNLAFDVKDTNGQALLDKASLFPEKIIRDFFVLSPDLFDDIPKLDDVNCEPAIAFINHMVSERNLQQLTVIEPPAASDEPICTKGLY